MRMPDGWDLYGIKAASDTSQIRLLATMEPQEVVFCIWRPSAKGGWHYRNVWAATTAFADWDGKGAPAAGEWRDFE